MNHVTGKVAPITGGARGRGTAHARLLVADGASVVLAVVLDADGEILAAELGDSTRFLHLDVTQEGDWANALRLTLAESGHLDVLVKNAGIANGWCDDDLYLSRGGGVTSWRELQLPPQDVSPSASRAFPRHRVLEREFSLEGRHERSCG